MEKCDFTFCAICPVEKCDIRKEKPNSKFRCNGNCYLCEKALHYHDVADGTPFVNEFSVCQIYHYQHHHNFQFYARVGKRDIRSKIEQEIYQYKKCKQCTFSGDVESLKNIIEKQEERGWLSKIDDGELLDNLKMTLTMLQDFKKEKHCPVAIGIVDLVTDKGITENKLLDLLKKWYDLPKCFFCAERSLRYLLELFENNKTICKDEDKWYKVSL